MCDDVAILHRGTVIAAGPIEQIRASDDRAAKVRVTTDLPSAASALLRNHGYHAAADGRATLITGADLGTVAQILTEAGVRIIEITTQRPSLEDVFLHLTRGESR